MKIKEIQEIINFIKKSDLDDVSIETENIKIRLHRSFNQRNNLQCSLRDLKAPNIQKLPDHLRRNCSGASLHNARISDILVVSNTGVAKKRKEKFSRRRRGKKMTGDLKILMFFEDWTERENPF